MDTTVDTGEVRAIKIGPHSVGLRAPHDWLTGRHLRLKDTVWVVGGLDGTVSFHRTKQEWSMPVMIRIKDRSYVFVTIPAELARTRGIVPGDLLMTRVDVQTGALIVQKLGRRTE